MGILHSINLSKITCERLTDILLIQIELLHFAAVKPIDMITKNGDKTILNKTEWKEKGEDIQKECAKHFDTKVAHFQHKGNQIAKWYFQANATMRIALLSTFSMAVYHQPTDIGRIQAWLQRLQQEVNELLNSDHEGSISIQNFFLSQEGTVTKQEAPNWQKAASDFFLYFYEYYLSDKHLFPQQIFTAPDAQAFGRENILHNFLEENRSLEICAICDQSRFYSRGQNKTYAILDHYFPKSIYPHLACHPYNLIPVCYSCNSSVKGDRDPLAARGGKILKKALPYRHNSSKQFYLDVSANERKEIVKIKELKVYQNGDSIVDPHVQEVIDLLKDIYKLPDRWNESQENIKIVDTLFRRMRHFLDGGHTLLVGTQVEIGINNALRQLLYYLAEEDQRKDPYGFALTWTLCAYLREREKNKDGAVWQSLVEEIHSWSGQSLAKSRKRDQVVSELLKMIP